MDKVSRDYVNIDGSDASNHIYVNQRVSIFDSELPVSKSHRGKEQLSSKPSSLVNPSLSAQENEYVFESMNESTPQQAGSSKPKSSSAPALLSIKDSKQAEETLKRKWSLRSRWIGFTSAAMIALIAVTALFLAVAGFFKAEEKSRNEFENIQSQLEDLKKETEELLNKTMKLTSENDKLVHKTTDLTNENDKLVNKTTDLTKENDDLQSHIASLEHENEEQQQRLQQLEDWEDFDDQPSIKTIMQPFDYHQGIGFYA